MSYFTAPPPRHHVIICHLLAYPPPSPSVDDVIYEQPLNSLDCLDRLVGRCNQGRLGGCRCYARSAGIPLFHQFLTSKPLEGSSRFPPPISLFQSQTKFRPFLLQDSLSHDIDMITWLAGEFYILQKIPHRGDDGLRPRL